jgi:hypothetical protein
VFLDCLKRGPSDCNELALCAFEQGAARFCGSGGGYPEGSGSCDTAQFCEGQCNQRLAPASCGCECVRAMSPENAPNLYINNQCAAVRCPTECSVDGSGPACNECHARNCQAANQQCVDN